MGRVPMGVGRGQKSQFHRLQGKSMLMVMSVIFLDHIYETTHTCHSDVGQ